MLSERVVNVRAHTQVLFGVAVKCGTYAEALKVANTPSIVPYSVYAIQGRFHTQTDNKYYQNCQSQTGGDNKCTLKPQGGDNKYPLNPLCGGGGENTLNTNLFIVCTQFRVDMYTLRCPITNVIEP